MSASFSRSLAVLSIVISSIIALGSCSSRNSPLLAITHVTVIDATGVAPQPDSTVIISGTHISAAGPSASIEIPRGAKVINGSGKFLIPGLADMHLHLTGAGEPAGSREFILPLLVANGITTVRDMGGKVEFLKVLRAEIDSGKRVGPQIFFTGPYLDGDPPAFQPSIVVQNSTQAAVVVQKLKAEGVDFIKVQSRLQPEAYLAIAGESRKLGIRFVGHVPDSLSSRTASAAGQASIEHLTGVLLACSTREDELRRRQLSPAALKGSVALSFVPQQSWQQDLLDSLDSRKSSQLIQTFVANRTWQVPTFPVLVRLAFLTPENDFSRDLRLRYVPANLRKIWEEGRQQSLLNQSPESIAIRHKLVASSLSIVRDMNAAGVPIMAGTDTTAPNVLPGFSLHEDLFYLVKAGLTPMQALQAATLKPAEFMGRGAEQGTIAVGRRADLLLLDANPLDDIRNTEKIRAVVLRGNLLERGELDALLARVERFAATH